MKRKVNITQWSARPRLAVAVFVLSAALSFSLLGVVSSAAALRSLVWFPRI